MVGRAAGPPSHQSGRLLYVDTHRGASWFGKRAIGKNSIHNTASVYNLHPAYAYPCVFTYTHGFWFVSLLLKIQGVAPSCFLMSPGAALGGADCTISSTSREACGPGMLETAARKTAGRTWAPRAGPEVGVEIRIPCQEARAVKTGPRGSGPRLEKGVGCRKEARRRKGNGPV